MPTFEAHTQYDDWTGSVAADDADSTSIMTYARKAGHLAEDDLVVGIDVFIGENHGGQTKPATIRLLTVKGNFDQAQATMKSDSAPLKVRESEFDLPVEKLMGLFKRFSLNMSRKGLDIEEYETAE